MYVTRHEIFFTYGTTVFPINRASSFACRNESTTLGRLSISRRVPTVARFLVGYYRQQAGPRQIAESLALYDRSRARLRDAYRMQKECPAVWTSDRVQAVFRSALNVPRDDHLKWMEALPWDEKADDPRKRVPVYVRGKVWDPPDFSICVTHWGCWWLVMKSLPDIGE